MASSSTTPQIFGGKAWTTDPGGVVNYLITSIRDVGAKFVDGDELKKTLETSANDLKEVINKDWSSCSSLDPTQRQNMDSAARRIVNAGETMFKRFRGRTFLSMLLTGYLLFSQRPRSKIYPTTLRHLTE